MARKENKCNGFSVYVREKHQLVGVTYVEGFTALRQNWNSLSPEEKEVYNRKAKKLNGDRKKMTNAGSTYGELEK